MQKLQKDLNGERLNALWQMIGTVKHEINNPLTTLLGNMKEEFMQILEEDINGESHYAFRQIIRTMKHEINNPLTALLGNVELLLEDSSLDSLTYQRLTIIRKLSFRLRDVVRSFPEISDLSE